MDLQKKAYKLRQNLTPAELELWTRLKKKKLNGFKFRRQHIISPYIVDFYCHAAKLVIEIDGESHCGKKKYDLRRHLFLEDQGLRIMRFTNGEVYNDIEKILSLICEHLES